MTEKTVIALPLYAKKNTFDWKGEMRLPACLRRFLPGSADGAGEGASVALFENQHQSRDCADQPHKARKIGRE